MRRPATPNRKKRVDGGVRIVSLIPSATEIVYALGLGDQLEGVTYECDFPPDARNQGGGVGQCPARVRRDRCAVDGT